MLVDKKKYLNPETIQRISRLELRAQYLVEGFLSGAHRNPHFGQSVEFLQHRQYAPGDDLRHVDWKVWAKQDRYYVKQYEADTNLRCTILIDVSTSMQYGRGSLSKYDYSATITATLAYLLLRQQDAVGCVTFDDSVRTKIPLRSKRNHLDSIVRSLTIAEPHDKTDVYHVLHQVAESYPQRGLMVLVSDLLTDVSSVLRGLKLLRQRGHDVIVFQVLDDDELEFPFDGPTHFDGLELPLRVRCNPRALRQGYLTALRAFLKKIRVGCGTHQVDYLLCNTSQPLEAVLTKFLSYRLDDHRWK